MKNHQNYQIENTTSTFVIPKSCWINKIVGEFSLNLVFTFMIVCNQLLLLEPQLFLKRWFCHQFCNFRTSPQLNAFAKISFQQQSPGFHRIELSFIPSCICFVHMNTMYISFVHMNIVSGVKKFTLNIAQIIFFLLLHYKILSL